MWPPVSPGEAVEDKHVRRPAAVERGQKLFRQSAVVSVRHPSTPATERRDFLFFISYFFQLLVVFLAPCFMPPFSLSCILGF